MSRFSERMGLVQVALQTDDIDLPLRNSIWNCISEMIQGDRDRGDHVLGNVQAIARDVLRVPKEHVAYQGARSWLLTRFSSHLRWDEVYEVLEYVVLNASEITRGRYTVAGAMEAANFVLEREHSGFHFVGGQLTRKIQPEAAAEVERAMTRAAAVGLDGVQQQIRQALVFRIRNRVNIDHGTLPGGSRGQSRAPDRAQ